MKLEICPFCQSPDVHIELRELQGGCDTITDNHIFMSDGEYIGASVICSQCYAEGPGTSAEIFDINGLNEIKNIAAQKWNSGRRDA